MYSIKKIDFLRSALGLKKETKKENSDKESFLFSSALTGGVIY